MSSARHARARRILVSRLRKAGATAYDKGIPLEPADGFELGELKKMLRRDVIRRTPKGDYWLDLERYGDWRRVNMLVAIGAAVVAMAIALAVLLNDPSAYRHRVAKDDTLQMP